MISVQLKRLDLYKTILGSMIRIALECIAGAIIGIFSLIIIGVTILMLAGGLLGSFLVIFPRIFILGWFGYQISKIFKRMRQEKEFGRKILRSNLIAPLLLILMFTLPWGLYHIITTTTKEQQAYGEYTDCEGGFTAGLSKEIWGDLEGGWKEFQGKKYKIQLCSKNLYSKNFIPLPMARSSFLGYKVRVAVFDEDGDLRSLGYFTSGGDSLFAFQIHDDSIEFGDWHDDSSNRIVKMPPSRLEWIRARLPTLDFFNN